MWIFMAMRTYSSKIKMEVSEVSFEQTDEAFLS